MTAIRKLLFGAALAVLLTPFAMHSLSAQTAELTVRSAAFEDDAPIPERNSAYGDNLSPAISWSGLPEGTRSLALVLADTSVPMPGGFVHWLVYNIPATAEGLPEGLPTDPVLSSPTEIAGATQGPAAMNNPGYFGPRPPAGNPPHAYVFTVYALDADLDLPEGLNRSQLLEAIEDHIIGQGQVTGTYQRTG